MKILYVCHRFPFPPKRGGKIRPFNMIRHLSARPRGDRRVARPLAGGGARRARASRRIAPGSRWPCVSNPVQVAAHGRAAADADAVVDRVLLLRRSSRARIRSPARRRALRPDLRALLVGRAVRRQRARAFRRSSTSATWTRRSGSSTRATSRSRCRSATGSKARSCEREEKRLARRFDLCTATTRAEWETLESYGTGVADRLVSERRGQRLLRARRRALRRRHDQLRRPHGLLPEPGVHVRVLPRRRCRCCRRGGRRSSSLIVGADPSPAVRRLGEICPA